MTGVADTIVACLRLGVELVPADGGASVLARGPAPALTPALRDALRAHKGQILRVLPRLQAMRRHGVDFRGHGGPELPMAIWPPPPVAPGRCFSCGDPLDHPRGCGRCAACAVACEIYWATRRPRPDEIAPPVPPRTPEPDEPRIVSLATTRGVLALPRAAVEFALALEARGFRVELGDDDRLVIEPEAALTADERAQLTRWRRHLLALVRACDAPPSRCM